MDKSKSLPAPASSTQVYDLIKVAAEILVVLQHITVMYSSHAAVPQLTSSRMLAALYSVLAAGTMPVFMCICGAVYQYCLSAGKYSDRLKFIGTKFKRLMIPYFVFSAFVVAPVVIKLGIVSWSYPEFLLYGTLLGGLTRHLWFCMSLFSIFLLCAIFKRALADCSPLILLPLVCLISYLGTRFVSPYFQLHQTVYFTLYFYLGMLINSSWQKLAELFRKHRILCLTLGGLGWLSVLLLPQLKYLPALGAILFVFTLACAVNTGKLEVNRAYKLLKRDSFGIYLLHPMLVYLIFHAFRYSTANPYLVSLLSFIAVYIVSVIFTEIIRKLHLGVIIGEKSAKKA